MRIVFIILAVIGILLLVILAIAAFCLFYPVSYRIKGEAEEELSLYGRFWWLFGLLWFEFDVRDFKPDMRFGILWFKRSFGGEEELQTEDTKGTQSEPDADMQERSGKIAASEERSDGKAELPVPAAESDGEAESSVSAAESDEEAESSVSAAESDGEAESSVSAAKNAAKAEPADLTETHDIDKKKKTRKKQNHAKTRAKPGKKLFRKKRSKAYQNKNARRQGTLKESFSKFRTELSDEKNHMAVKHFWQEATYIFTHLKPKYANGAIYFAAGDPALTGQLTGMLSLLPVMYQYDACICPDFVSEEPYIRGKVVFGGRMFLIHAVFCLIRIIRDENAMKFIQKFR